MKTLEVKNYKEAYLRLMVDVKCLNSPVRDLSKYIDKMLMIGKKYKQLEGDIIYYLDYGESNGLGEVSMMYNTEFQVLQLMTDQTCERFRNNSGLREAVALGDTELERLVEDFKIVRLTVKARAMGAKAEMQELLSRLDRHRTSLLVK